VYQEPGRAARGTEADEYSLLYESTEDYGAKRSDDGRARRGSLGCNARLGAGSV